MMKDERRNEMIVLEGYSPRVKYFLIYWDIFKKMNINDNNGNHGV